MSTDKPRFTVTVSDETKKRIEDFFHSSKFKNQSQAVNQLIERGLDSMSDHTANERKLKMNVGERIVDLRSENGMTRVQLAEKLGIPMTTLRNYEIGTREPGHKFILDVAHVFNVTTDYLLGMTDEPKRNIAAQNLSISKAEMEGIKKYRALDEHGKELVELVLEKEFCRLIR